jgi:hypothetical protein
MFSGLLSADSIFESAQQSVSARAHERSHDGSLQLFSARYIFHTIMRDCLIEINGYKL